MSQIPPPSDENDGKQAEPQFELNLDAPQTAVQTAVQVAAQNKSEADVPDETQTEIQSEEKVEVQTEPQTASQAELQEEPQDEDELSLGSHGHKPKERKDIASGELMDPAYMIRLAAGPDGQIVADIFGKIPGRGFWVASDRESVEQAVAQKAFARAAKRKVIVPDKFADLIEMQLKTRVLGLIGMANRAGQLEFGFDKVKALVQDDQIAYRIEASDGSMDGRSKIRVIAKAIAREIEAKCPPVIACFDGMQLGKVIGREHSVHLAVKRGKLAKALKAELSRLNGFCAFIPVDWPDYEHEDPFVPFS